MEEHPGSRMAEERQGGRGGRGVEGSGEPGRSVERPG